MEFQVWSQAGELSDPVVCLLTDRCHRRSGIVVITDWSPNRWNVTLSLQVTTSGTVFFCDAGNAAGEKVDLPAERCVSCWDQLKQAQAKRPVCASCCNELSLSLSPLSDYTYLSLIGLHPP